MKINVYDLLMERGFIHTATHPELLRTALEKPTTFYLGIDPTADNLHIGHLLGLRMFEILQKHGHKGILLIGNATAMVGDPSFKNDMRKMLSKDEVTNNATGIKNAVSKFIDTKKATIVFNGDWFNKMNPIYFLTTVGKHFTVAKMLSHECYKNRLTEEGLTLFEMNYMLMQAYDFVELNEKHNCTLQIGGSDQWANITAGVDLGRRMAFTNGKTRPEMFGLCCPLLTNSDGTKMGKTEKGAVWVDATKTSVYDCYQYFINVNDKDVEKLLTFFTDLPVAGIKKMCSSDIISAKKHMAFAMTEHIHGKEQAVIAQTTAEKLFSGNTAPANTPTETISTPPLATIVDILACTTLVSSKREAREFVTNGAISIDGEKITDITYVPTIPEFTVKKGKKTFLKIIIK